MLSWFKSWSCDILPNHHTVPVRRTDEKLSHTMWFVGRRLKDDGTAADEFVVKCVHVVHIEVAKIAVISGCRRRHCVRAMTHHDAHTASRRELPTRSFGPLKVKAECVTKV